MVWATGVIFEKTLLEHDKKRDHFQHLGGRCWERSYLRQRLRQRHRRQRRVGQSNLATGNGRRYRPPSVLYSSRSLTWSSLSVLSFAVLRHSLLLYFLRIDRHAESRCCSSPMSTTVHRRNPRKKFLFLINTTTRFNTLEFQEKTWDTQSLICVMEVIVSHGRRLVNA